MQIHGIGGMSADEVDAELAAGGRFVFYEYCISLILLTLRRQTSVYFLRPGELGLIRGLPFTLLSLLLGWWGLPWGIIYTPMVLVTNFSGGCDVTPQVQAMLHRKSAEDKAVFR
jgi:hypothetical protein